MTNPLEQHAQQTEFLPSVDPEILDEEARLILRDYFQPDVDEIAAKIRQIPEPSLGYWEPCVRDYANSDSAPDLDRSKYEDEARTKAPEERNAFDKFILGVSINPEDVRAPEGSHLTPYGYYKDTGKRLLTAIEEGKVPEGFEDPVLLAKATDFLLARGINQLFATPSRANEDLKTALTLYRKATERIPGFYPEQAGSENLIRTGIACRAILKAESPHFAQTRSAGREQAAQMLQIASEALALDNIHSDTTLTKRYERQAAYDQELAKRELQQERDQGTQHDIESWPTEEPDTDDSNAYPEVITSLKTNVPEKETTDDSKTTPPEVPVRQSQDPSTEQARQSVDEAFNGGQPRYPEGQTTFKDTSGLNWERPAYNTVDIPSDHRPSNPDTSVWQAPGARSETEHTLVPVDIRVDQQPSTGVTEQFEPENQIGKSKVDQFLTNAAAGLRRWYRASATNNPDSRLKSKIAKGFGALTDLGKGTPKRSLTAAEMDARDEAEYARVDALLGEGNDITYDSNGDAVVNAEPKQPKQTRRRRRQAQKLANSATEQPVRPQTAAESKLEEVRQQLDAANARRDRINDHLNHGEHDMVEHEIRDMPTRELLGLPADIVANLDTNAREQWEVRFVREARPPYPPPYPQILRTEAGRQAYQDRYPNRKYSW